MHSLLIVREGSMLVDAYFYPYDGSTYHDLASVTKSVVATLIGIAAAQGRLDLDAPIPRPDPGPWERARGRRPSSPSGLSANAPARTMRG